jgi:xanthine dehydrogenase molybdenum-binding subunit
MTYVCGANGRALAAKLRDQLIEAAAELLGVSPGILEAANGRVQRIGGTGPGLSYPQIVQGSRMHHGRDMIVTHTYIGTSNPGSYSVQFAEVEVDVLTGLTRVTQMLTAIDIGRAINREMVEGQCRGAIQAGIGSALCEEVVIDSTGRAGAGGFKSYHLVNAADMPPVTVLLVEHDGDDGPYGAKSVGEIATVPTAAAVVNAVNRALGTFMTTLPLTPERIVAALDETAEFGGRSASCA